MIRPGLSSSNPSLFRRLAVLIAAVLGAGAVVLGLAAWSYARHAADEAYDRLLLGAALQIAETVTVQSGQVSVDPPVSAFETLSFSANDRIFYKVLDPRGAVLTGDGSLPARQDFSPSEGPALTEVWHKGAPVRMALVGRYIADPGIQGWALVAVAQTQEARAALAWDLTWRASLLVLGMSVLALAAAMVAIRRALVPLAHVEHALALRDPKDLEPLQVETPREIEALIGAINHFMQRLQVRVGVMQRFIADAAHQLRTPLTALASQVDLLASEPDTEKQARAIARISERTSELGRLANQLLSHAMVIHRAEAIPFEEVDLIEVARRALHDGVPLATERDIAVVFEAPPHPVLIHGDPVSLREAVANVVHNAVKHGARTHLQVTVRKVDDRVHVEVSDDGPGIPEAEWQRVKEPFKGRGDGQSGSSLGLAIVSDVVRAHGGSLAFGTSPAGDFTVSLTFGRSGLARSQGSDR